MEKRKKELETYDRDENEMMRSFTRMFQDLQQQYVDEIKDPSTLFQSAYRLSGPEEFDRFPHSPTAQKYKLAFNCYLQGLDCLHEYKKDTVETDQDCDLLEAGFRSYAVGYVLENVMVGHFRPPDHTMKLLDQYLQFRPTDSMAEYFKLRLYLRDQSTQEKLMKNIIACEVLANKIESRKINDDDRFVLTDVYSVVASLYTVSKQGRRAVDSFEKAYKLDERNSNALYGIAFNLTEEDPERAEALHLKFLKETPHCDKKYPNVLYNLSEFYFVNQKINKAARYFEMAVKSERNRLPFLPEVDMDAKIRLTQTMPLLQSKGYCNNPECSTEAEGAELKKCSRCKNVSYCGRECQKQDWSYHKKSCKIL